MAMKSVKVLVDASVRICLRAATSGNNDASPSGEISASTNDFDSAVVAKKKEGPMLLDEGLTGNGAMRGMRWDGEHGSIGRVMHP
jgi:hypothetical protein